LTPRARRRWASWPSCEMTSLSSSLGHNCIVEKYIVQQDGTVQLRPDMSKLHGGPLFDERLRASPFSASHAGLADKSSLDNVPAKCKRVAAITAKIHHVVFSPLIPFVLQSRALASIFHVVPPPRRRSCIDPPRWRNAPPFVHNP
jgi:hypothetical protein